MDVLNERKDLYASRSLSRKDEDIVTQLIHSSGFCPVSDPYVIWMW